MIFYDWRKIYRVSRGRTSKILQILRILNGYKPKNFRDKLYPLYLKDYNGKSFLINLSALIDEDFYYSAKEIAEYVALASYRNYAHYVISGDTSLDLLHSPVGQDIINKNRLLSIENGRVRFKFEEATQGEN